MEEEFRTSGDVRVHRVEIFELETDIWMYSGLEINFKANKIIFKSHGKFTKETQITKLLFQETIGRK